MSKFIFSQILEGIDDKIDFVAAWRPLLEKPEQFNVQTREKLAQLGARSLAVVAIAAIEQKARQKLLQRGTVEKLRLRSFHNYRETIEFMAFEVGQLVILERLQEERPDLKPWLSKQLDELREHKNQIWRLTAANTLKILSDIQGQLYRKGRKGRLQVFGGKGIKPAHHYSNLIDAEIIKNANWSLAPSMRNDLASNKKAARKIVQEYVGRDTLRAGTLTLKEAIDKHCKRIYRKLTILDKAQQAR